MRVGFDLHVVDGLFQGSRTHVIEIFSRVAQMCPEIQFIGLLDDVESFKKNYPAFNLPNVRLERLKHSSAMRRLMWELPRMQKRLKLDLLHTQYIVPLPSFSKTVVTIHDVLFESHPEYFRLFFRLRSQVLMRLAAYQSAHVFTVSEYSKTEIRGRFGVPIDRISVSTNAADVLRFYPGAEGADYLSHRGLETCQFFLTVGRLEPRKNHVTLFKAYAALGPDVPPLVVVGQKDFGFEAIFEEIANDSVRKRVIFLENVGDRELPALYRHCLAFVYPSLAEGFGMPPLEAMASGVPVIVANNTALTEVVGNAGLLVSSTDVTALRDAMASVASDRGLREVLIARGLEQAKRFSWDDAAAKVAERYRKILLTGEQKRLNLQCPY